MFFVLVILKLVDYSFEKVKHSLQKIEKRPSLLNVIVTLIKKFNLILPAFNHTIGKWLMLLGKVDGMYGGIAFWFFPKVFHKP